MSVTYTPTTNFGAKDSLPSNDPSKVIKGSEFSVEFTAIQTAFSLAAPVASPTFTGTVTIPTADINGGNIDGTVIGAATPAAGSFTTGQFDTSLNVDGTVTADGLTLDSGVYKINNTSTGSGSDKWIGSDGGAGVFVNAGTSGNFNVYNNNSVARFGVNGTTGDISFYEDTGTTPKFFWDASAEALGIGTTSPASRLEISNANTSADEAGPIFTITNESQSVTAANIALGEIDFVSNDPSTGGTGVGGSLGVFSERPFDGGPANTYLSFSTRSGSTVSEKVRITSAGNVGIGTTSPACGLDVSNAGNGSVGEQVRITSTDDTAKLAFVNTGGNGAITQNSGAMIFQTNTANNERMRLDASGNLLVGKTDTTGNVAGISLRSTGLIVGTVSGGTVGYFNRTTSDGTILDFRKDNTAVGSIGTDTSRFKVKSSSLALYLENESNKQLVWGNVSSVPYFYPQSDNDTNLGYPTQRFKDLYLSGGVYLGGTGAANKLDDYETGTWTPNGNWSATSAFYVKIGDLVHLSIDLTADGTGGTSQITNLPFAAQGTVGTGIYVSSVDWAAGYTSPTFVVAGTTGYFRVVGDSQAFSSMGITAGGTVHLSITYQVA